MDQVKTLYPFTHYGVTIEITPGYWKKLEETFAKAKRGKERGAAFVGLYAAAKQLTDNFPKRYPYLESAVKSIEEKGLAPKLDNGRR